MHGLNGNAERTWTSPKTGFFWPLELTKDMPTARVMLFGYDTLFEPSLGSNQIRLPNIARKLLQDLAIHRLEDAVRTSLFRYRYEGRLN